MKLIKFAKFLSVSALSAMLLTACGGESDISTKEKSDDTAQIQKEDNKKEPKVGTRSNPIKINEIASIDTVTYDEESNEYKTKVDLSVEEVVRGAEAQQKLKEMNEFNEKAPEGYEWLLVNAKVKVVESETEDYPFTIDGIMNFKFVSESGDIYSGDIIGTTDPDFSFEMYKGNEKEGYISGLVKAGEEAKMEYDSWVGNKVFFNLK
ncbi:hypothetical protein [Lederbergia lenta]|uniref:Uncharacterized protein n=1 Tax=Lederbergia lenta TaxID=1467 RepID=A0A2X4Z5S8_LEDLE|nr:hypothetical protein [Lederbergia lenta]MCM3109731.1 hypothetical protein [Lederbergia lenta]MEC2324518.1 hypothetical protein [Lederbergia lenta]SQI59605.1 Uncharacterised protein [Lederbergia lenta]